MRWLMGGLDPAAISAFMGVAQAAPVEDVADLRVIFPGDRIASAHLSWRSPVRRTRAMIYGSEAALEIDGDRVTLTARSGKSEDVSPTPSPTIPTTQPGSPGWPPTSNVRSMRA